MPGKTPAEAVEAYRARLQQTLSCITDAVLLFSEGGWREVDELHAWALSDDPVQLSNKLRLSVAQQYQIIRNPRPEFGKWKVSTRAYSYLILDEVEREILAYQWQPEGPSPYRDPHLHIGPGAVQGYGELCKLRPIFDRAHLPTERIALEDVVLFLIDDFGVDPKRDDYRKAIGENRDAFREYRSWP